MKRIVLGALLIAAASTTVAGALSGRGTGPHPFSPIAGSAYNQTADLTAPFVIPSGYTQKVVSDDTDLDIYNSRCASGTTNPDSDWPDMTVSNESGRQRGRRLTWLWRKRRPTCREFVAVRHRRRRVGGWR